MPTGNANFVTSSQLGHVKGDVTKLTSQLGNLVTQDDLARALTSDGFNAVVDKRVSRAVKEIGADGVAEALLDHVKFQEKILADMDEFAASQEKILAATKSTPTKQASTGFVGRGITWTADKLAPESEAWNTTIRTIGWATFMGLLLEGVGFALNLPQVRPSTYVGKLF